MLSPNLPQQLPETVRVFRAQLRHLPLNTWVTAARQLADEHDTTAPLSGAGARARLRAATETIPEVTARVRRGVTEMVAVAEGIVHPRDTRLMRKAALSAALALAVRPVLSEEDFEELYRPFADLIPIEVVEEKAADNEEAASVA